MRLTTIVAGTWGRLKAFPVAAVAARRTGHGLVAWATAVTLAAGLAGYGIFGAAAGTGRPASGPGAHPAAAGPEASASLDGNATAAARPQLPPQSTVTLVTGNRLRIDAAPGGALTITPLASPGVPAASGPFLRFTWAGDQYVVPAVAAPYLGSLLDPRLFDVSYLIQAKLGESQDATLPVQVTHDGNAVPAVPGLRVTGASGDSASGTLAIAQGPALDRLLAQGWHKGADSPFSAGTRIGLARPRGGPALPSAPAQYAAGTAGSASSVAAPGTSGVQPAPEAQAGDATSTAVPYYRLTLNFTGTDGQSAAAIGFVQNVDNAVNGGISYFLGSAPRDPVASGPVSFSVPAGTYSLEFAMISSVPGGVPAWVGALVAKPQVTVDSNETITLDARTAVPYQPTLNPAAGGLPSVREDAIGFSRSSVTGGGLNVAKSTYTLSMGLMSQSGGGAVGATLSATPTGTVTKGTFSFDATSFYSAGGNSQPQQPTYFLDFPSQDRIPSSLTYTVGPADLTTVNQQLYHAPSGGDTGPVVLWEYPYHPRTGDIASSYVQSTWNAALGGESFVVSAGNRTDYVYASDPRLDTWVMGFKPSNGHLANLDEPRTLYPGEQITETWDKGPMVPSPAAPAVDNFLGITAGGSPLTAPCTACRQDDNGILDLMPSGDSDPGHYAQEGDTGSQSLTSFTFYRNGTPALSSSDLNRIASQQVAPLLLPLLPEAATYRLDWALARNTDPAATTETDWTFESSPASPAADLPAGEECLPDTSRGCSFLPLLFLTYDLNLNSDSQAVAGQLFQIAFTADHQENEPAPTGVTATVSASFDGGRTWTAAQSATSQGNGHFTATITQPALAQTDGYVALRVTATDGAGDSVTQTILRAYGLTI